MLWASLAFPQENSSWNIGVGMPVFKGNYNESSYEYSIGSLPSIFVEKPLEINFLNIDNLIIGPGLAFLSLRESGNWGGMGGGGTRELTHKSLNSYLKITQRNLFNKKNHAQWYFGAITGIHLFTRTTGEKSSHSVFTPQANWTNSDFKDSAHNFFHSFYFGLVAGFEPKIQGNSILKPTFEFSFYPAFVTINENKVSAVGIYVLFEINTQKKEPPK